jgi:cellulose 1,4-beta-cellobiosidase
MDHGIRALLRHRRFGSVRVVAALGVAVTLGVGASVSLTGVASAAPTPSPSTEVSGVDAAAETGNDAGPLHVDNPYAGARLYVDPEWSAQAAADGGGAIANQPTAVWLDSIASIPHRPSGARYRTMGLVEHLDAALAQGADAVQLVLWNLPGRACSRLSSDGELGQDEIDRYGTEYVDPIVEILSRPQYAGLRIITIVEPDSLPNLVTNVGMRDTQTPLCDSVLANGAYVQGIVYALSRLHELANVYTYLDAGHHGWLGWDDNFFPTARLLADTAAQATGGLSRVDGIIVNVANYSALVEPFLTVTDRTRMTTWIDWNDYVDELSYSTAFRDELVSLGFDPGLGILIDTSRNGWGGPDRPTAKAPGDDDQAVDASRIDRRIRITNWCNQQGAGLGERPQADPAPGIDAYVWAKPPGESDGASEPIANDEGLGFDQMCNPTYNGPPRGSSWYSGALGGAPLAGAWFSAHFQTLLANAYPPL